MSTKNVNRSGSKPTEDQTRRLLDACKRRKQALMQKLLTGTWRFPEFGKPVMGMEFPLGWETAPFFDGKDFGYIIDYRGVFDRLHAALDLYGTFSGFDEADLNGTLIDIREIIAQLPQAYSILLDSFKEASSKRDTEQYIRFLDDEERRIRFYDKFAQFTRLLKNGFVFLLIRMEQYKWSHQKKSLILLLLNEC